ncbi:hypothetical protein BBK82_31510 [Lentzea guizhouensis]|uniref:Uncharacterized protein n=1 Tax=Lentzea guizhouensis TaxID=1586287 RepID=A0A1B2HQA7_9PSEU|nr:hypothetical protein BBK82_31510 [Lentzea guizhouensis]
MAGFLIGFGLLSVGVANADDGEPSGLLGGVTTLLSPVTEPVLAPLAPIVGAATQALDPVLEPLRPVTAPVLTPLVRTVQDVPVVPRIVDPLTTRSSAPGTVPPPVVVPVAPAVPAVSQVPQVPVVVPEVRTVTWHDRVVHDRVVHDRGVVAVPTQRQQFDAPEVAPPIEAPSQPSPDVPLVMPGTTGSASAGGSAGPAAGDLPAAAGVRPNDESLVVTAADQVHGSWCYYYGRSHPS